MSYHRRHARQRIIINIVSLCPCLGARVPPCARVLGYCCVRIGACMLVPARCVWPTRVLLRRCKAAPGCLPDSGRALWNLGAGAAAEWVQDVVPDMCMVVRALELGYWCLC